MRPLIASAIVGAACCLLSGCAATKAQGDAVAFKLDLSQAVGELRNEMAAKLRWRHLQTRDEIAGQTEQLKSEAKYNFWAIVGAILTGLGTMAKQHGMAALTRKVVEANGKAD